MDVISDSHGSQNAKYENVSKHFGEASYSQRRIVKEIGGHLQTVCNQRQIRMLYALGNNPAIYSVLSVSSQERIMRLIRHLSMNFNREQVMLYFLSHLCGNILNSLNPAVLSNLGGLNFRHSRINLEFLIHIMSNRTNLRRQLMVVNEQNELAIASLVNPLILNKCIVYPCNHQFAFHEPRSLYCRVVSVIGLPKIATKEIVEEIFERCGRILGIQMRNKKCQIKFANKTDVRKALNLSGCTVRIENKDERLYTGELSVDCIDTDARLNKALEIINFKVHSFNVASSVLNDFMKLKENNFESALRALKVQMEQSVCNQVNFEFFYIMIQEAYNHLGLLMEDIWVKENELSSKKLNLKHFMKDMLVKLDEIEKIFNPACMRNICNFLKMHQKNRIEMQKKHCEDFKENIIEQLRSIKTDEATDESKNELDITKTKLEDEHLYRGELSIDCVDTGAQWNQETDVIYSYEHAQSLMNNLKENTFESTLRTLTKWMEQGVCNPGNYETFYLMIQRAICHLGLLMNVMWDQENELFQKKLNLKHFMKDVLIKLDEIEKIFNPVCMRDIDSFLKMHQKNNIKMRKRHCGDFKKMVTEQLRNLETDEASDESKIKFDIVKMKLNELQEENETLSSQLKTLDEVKTRLQAEQIKAIELKKKGRKRPRVNKN